MRARESSSAPNVLRRLAEAEATIEALLTGQIDAVVDTKSQTPVLLSRAQAELRESEARYRRIVETTHEGIWTTDPDAVITFVNQPLAAMLGHRPPDLLGKSLRELVVDVPPGTADALIERARRGVSEEREVAFVRRDGTHLWALLKTVPIQDAYHEHAGTLAVMTDRTRDRRADEALRKSEEQYRQIVETTSDGILKIDERVLIVFVNRRLADMLGYTPDEMVGRSAFDFMSAAAQESVFEQGRSEKTQIDTAFRAKDGTDIAVDVAVSRLSDDQGRATGYLGVVRDVTERKKLQAQLMVSDRMASVGTLAAGVAHEINNPLAAVIANLDYFAETLSRRGGGGGSGLAEELVEPLADARAAAERVRFIVRDLKLFSRSPNEVTVAAVDVDAVMESTLRMGWNEIRHRAQLVKLYGRVPAVRANEARLGQVFLNLIVNAAQAIPEGRAEHNEIRVATRLAGDRVVVEVSDTGPGIPPEILGRIFDPFFTTKAVGVGTGLGLAICQRIVTDCGGELTVESELGVGTTFRISIPVAPIDEPRDAPAPPDAPVAARRGRILIVDDEELVLRAITRLLSKEHDVVATTSAADALARCSRGEAFDLLLCDLMMPDMTGMDLHRELSLAAPEQASRMIFLTGGAFTVPAQRFLSEEPKEYIQKPFDGANLRAIVQRYLR